MSYCSQCGKELVQGAKFCQNCGAPVESAAAAGTGAAGDGSASANTSSGDSSSASYAGYYERQNAQSQNAQRQNAQPNYNYVEQDIPSTGLNVLAFFLPLVGLILYVVNVDSKPVMAKAIGKWALIGFIVGIVGSVLLSIIYGVAVASFMFL